jgi:hypothetical protein
VKEETNIRQELATIVQDLPAERVKIAVIEWLSLEKGDIADLKQNLFLKAESNQSQMIYGAIDINGDFTPLSEEEMIAQSSEALNEYKLHGCGVSQQSMSKWAASLGTDGELPCPK